MQYVGRLALPMAVCTGLCFIIFETSGQTPTTSRAGTEAEVSSSVLADRLQAAVKDAQGSDAGKRAAAVIALREIAADTAASPVLRHEALFRVAQARELDRALPELILDAYRQASAAAPGGENEVTIGLRVAALLAAQGDSRGARQVLEPLAARLDTLPREVQVSVLTQLAAVLTKDGDQAGAAACTMRMIDNGLVANEAQEVQLYLKAATALVAAGEPASAIKIVNNLLGRTPSLSHANYKIALLWLVQQHLAVPDPDAAVAALRVALDMPNDFPLADTLDLRLRVALILRTGKGDTAAAIRECRAILQAVDALPAASRGAFKGVCDGAIKELAAIYSDTGQADALVSLMSTVLEDISLSHTIVSSLTTLVLPVVATNRIAADRLLNAVRECIAMNVVNATLCDVCQQAIVEMLLAQREREAEVLQEVRILFRTVKADKLGDAIDMVARAFKQKDKNLARANGFLRYLSYGADGADGKPGTGDDLDDPLAVLPAVLAGAPRNRPYETALAKRGDGWADWLVRSRLLLYMDRSPEAFDAQTQAFARCPTQEKMMQPVVDDLVALVMRITRDESLGKRVVDYIMHGAAGADGKVGTNDDLSDVFAIVAERLSFIQKGGDHGQFGR